MKAQIVVESLKDRVDASETQHGFDCQDTISMGKLAQLEWSQEGGPTKCPCATRVSGYPQSALALESRWTPTTGANFQKLILGTRHPQEPRA